MLRRLLIVGFGLMALFGALGVLFAQAAGRLYVVNSFSKNVTVIDTGTDTVIGTIPLELQGYHIAFAPDGKVAYVTLAPQALAQSNLISRLEVLDLVHGKAGGSIPLAFSPLSDVHISRDGKQAYIVTAAPPGNRNGQRGQVLFVDLTSAALKQTLPVGLNPLCSVMTPDGSRLFTADWASHSISIVDLAHGKLLDTLPLGTATTRVMALSPDGRKLYSILERQITPIPNNAMFSNSNAVIYNTAQNVAQTQAFPVEDKLLWEIDTTSGAVAKYPLEGLSPVYTLAIPPDGSALYAYGRTTTIPLLQNTNAEKSPQTRLAPYDLIQIDLRTKNVLKHLGNYGYLAGMVCSADGSKLYLIGTPGDPRREAVVQANYTRSQTNMPLQDPAKRLSQTQLLQDLSQLPKTVTGLDTRTGKTLKILPIGSFPQGSGLAPR